MNSDKELKHLKWLSYFDPIKDDLELNGCKVVHKVILDEHNHQAEIFVALANIKLDRVFSNGIGDLKQICYDLNLPYGICEVIYLASINPVHIIVNEDKSREKFFCRKYLLEKATLI